MVEPFAFKSGHTIDVAKAIEQHPQVKKLLPDEATTPGFRRTMVKAAFIVPSRSKDWPTPMSSPVV